MHFIKRNNCFQCWVTDGIVLRREKGERGGGAGGGRGEGGGRGGRGRGCVGGFVLLEVVVEVVAVKAVGVVVERLLHAAPPN